MRCAAISAPWPPSGSSSSSKGSSRSSRPASPSGSTTATARRTTADSVTGSGPVGIVGRKGSVPEMATIAALGMGVMGAPMARNLARAGHDVRAWNRSPEKAAPLRVATGVDVCADPASAAAGADVVLTMLADADAVLDVAHQADLAEGQIWWQASTIGIDGIEQCAGLARGGRRRARRRRPRARDADAGRGGQAPDPRLRPPTRPSTPGAPLFDAVGQRTMRLGTAGTATRLKLAVNTWVLAVTQGTAETIAVAQALGSTRRRSSRRWRAARWTCPIPDEGRDDARREFPASFGSPSPPRTRGWWARRPSATGPTCRWSARWPSASPRRRGGSRRRGHGRDLPALAAALGASSARRWRRCAAKQHHRGEGGGGGRRVPSSSGACVFRRDWCVS